MKVRFKLLQSQGYKAQRSRYSPRPDWSWKNDQQQLKYVFLKMWDSSAM